MLLKHNWRNMVVVVGITVGGTSAFYTYTTYMQKYLKLSVGLTDDQTTTVTLVSLVFAAAIQPLYGAVSDRIGRKAMLVGFGVLGTLGTVPILTAIRSTHSPVVALLLDLPRLGDRQRLHLGDRDREGGTVSERPSGHSASAFLMRSRPRSSAVRSTGSRCSSRTAATRPVSSGTPRR